MQNNFDTQNDESIPVPSPMSSAAGVGSIFQGNGYDLAAFVGVIVGGMTLLSCFTFGVGQYCMPIIPIILGVIGLLTAKDSLNPDRTRRLSWLSIAAGAVILLLIIIFVGFYIGLIVFGVAADSGF
ncbi:MAG: hypothetical protein KDJ52_15060 [Anaerolineae bacterium]|nr:hypothetical protein [Anaerolineae bacterium]